MLSIISLEDPNQKDICGRKQNEGACKNNKFIDQIQMSLAAEQGTNTFQYRYRLLTEETKNLKPLDTVNKPDIEIENMDKLSQNSTNAISFCTKTKSSFGSSKSQNRNDDTESCLSKRS